MTALKPIENRRVRGVAAERYPLNAKCAHPECNEDAVDGHHCFPRSAIGNDSWFVSIADDDLSLGPSASAYPIIPHVAGLCRAHHEDVEQHRAWIKLEASTYGGDQFVWYDRWYDVNEEWHLIGPLNPQPGSREGKPKRKRFKGEARRTRSTISLKVPKDADEDGAAVFDELIEQARELLGEPDKPIYYILVAALYVFVRDFRAEDAE